MNGSEEGGLRDSEKCNCPAEGEVKDGVGGVDGAELATFSSGTFFLSRRPPRWLSARIHSRPSL